MPIANNLFTGAIIAPLITFLAAISLATVQRGIEWVSSVAKNPQKYVIFFVMILTIHLSNM